MEVQGGEKKKEDIKSQSAKDELVQMSSKSDNGGP